MSGILQVLKTSVYDIRGGEYVLQCTGAGQRTTL